MNKIYIVRHGKTDWNAKSLLQGTIDIELNDEGINQAKELASQIDLSQIDICFCSPLKRAKQTAEILVNGKLKIIYDPMLIERDFGDYEGKPIEFELVQKQWDYQLNDASHNIESVQNCLKRAQNFLNKIKKEDPNKTILIVSHGSFIKALHFNLIGYDENTNFMSFKPENCIIYEYILD